MFIVIYHIENMLSKNQFTSHFQKSIFSWKNKRIKQWFNEIQDDDKEGLSFGTKFKQKDEILYSITKSKLDKNALSYVIFWVKS